MTRLNSVLDTLPRTRFGCATREVPAFRTCGIVGFYLAVATAMGAALLAGVSLLVMSVVAVICGASFFLYVYIRRWLTGRETLELIDQVWFAELCTAGVLLALGVPLLPHLDVLAVSLCPFLAAGRVGCTLVGCCHGRPSSVGITYGEEHARDGFPPHMVGIRLFPVPAVEAIGLLFIGLIGLISLPFAPAGHVFAWFLIGYAILRFGLEWLRGDRRPHWAGFSKPQWMSIVEFGVGVWIVEGAGSPVGTRELALASGLSTVLLLVLHLRRRFDASSWLLSQEHVEELRMLVREAVDEPGSGPPNVRRSSRGASVAVGRDSRAPAAALHFSYSLPESVPHLELMCRLAARTIPDVYVAGSHWSNGVLHLFGRIADADHAVIRSDRLYTDVVRQLQGAETGIGSTLASIDAKPDRDDYFGVAGFRRVRVTGDLGIGQEYLV